MLKIASIQCFSILLCIMFVTGCVSFDNGLSDRSWPVPERPTLSKVHFEPVDGGFFIQERDAIPLADNVDALKAHIDKLEELIKSMQEYYNKRSSN